MLHAPGHISGELQQLLRAEASIKTAAGTCTLVGVVLFGVRLAALPQEVQKISMMSVFSGDVQDTFKGNRSTLVSTRENSFSVPIAKHIKYKVPT